jgi:hypothetical protein
VPTGFRTEGLEEWKVRRSQQVREWQREAEIKLTRDHLLEALRVCLHAKVPEDLASAVAAMTDFGELSRLFRLALTAGSLEAFLAEVRLPPTDGPTS